MRIKYSFEAVDMGDEIVLVPIGEGAANIHGILKTNKEGREIIALLDKDTTEEKIVDILAQKYENDRESLVVFVHDVVTTLRGVGLIEE